MLHRAAWLLSAALATGLSVIGAPSGAITPSRLWSGAERVVVSCDADESAHEFKSKLCAAAISHIRSRVPHPVLARADATGGDPAADLIIKLSARQSRPNAIELTVRPKRIEIMNEAPAALVMTIEGSVQTSADLSALVARSLVKILGTN